MLENGAWREKAAFLGPRATDPWNLVNCMWTRERRVIQ